MVSFNKNGDMLWIYRVFMNVVRLDRQSRRSTMVFAIILLVQMAITLTCLIHPLAHCNPYKVWHSHVSRVEASIFNIVCNWAFQIKSRCMIAQTEAAIEDWSTVTDPVERDIMQRHNRRGRFAVWITCLYKIVYSLVSGFMSLPFIYQFISKDEQDECAFNVNAMWSNILPVLSFISALFTQMTGGIIVALFWNFTMHLSGQFKILKKQFQDFLQIKNKKASREELRRLVDRHNLIFDLGKNLNELFIIHMAVEIFSHQLRVCTFTARLALSEDWSVNTSRLCNFLSIAASTVQLCYLNYHAGEYLTTCSEEIGEVFTQCNWYDLSKESITNFSIIIARCQKPSYLRAFGIFKLTHSNLKHVIEAIYSYTTCLMAVAKFGRN